MEESSYIHSSQVNGVVLTAIPDNHAERPWYGSRRIDHVVEQ